MVFLASLWASITKDFIGMPFSFIFKIGEPFCGCVAHSLIMSQSGALADWLDEI